MPTLLVFRGGEVVGAMVGARPKAALRARLAELGGALSGSETSRRGEEGAGSGKQPPLC